MWLWTSPRRSGGNWNQPRRPFTGMSCWKTTATSSLLVRTNCLNLSRSSLSFQKFLKPMELWISEIRGDKSLFVNIKCDYVLICLVQDTNFGKILMCTSCTTLNLYFSLASRVLMPRQLRPSLILCYQGFIWLSLIWSASWNKEKNYGQQREYFQVRTT